VPPGHTAPSFTARIARATGPLRHLDLSLAAASLVLSLIGVVLIYSATHAPLDAAGLDRATFATRQALWVVLGVVAMVAVAALDYRRIVDTAAVYYLGAIGLLLVVLSPIGAASQGAQRWIEVGIFRLQPSEFAELALVAALAALCHRTVHLDDRRLLAAIGLAAVPLGLVLVQPDLGTALVFGIILVVVLFIAGTAPKHLAILGALVVVAGFAALSFDLLEDYQRDRLSGFLDPESDPTGASYNVAQSQVAIGAGGMTGTGLFEGSQTRLGYVPEQHTDFVFTVAAEELGFLGAATILSVFALLAWRVWRAALVARDRVGTLLCAGVLAMVVFKVFQNVGMTAGIMPITGIPLPFISYGGSATIASFMAIGLVLNVGMRRFA
jgi:rod shape determining protein RodA